MIMTSETVGAFEAKTHFSDLLARATSGETITVTKHGQPVAQIVPFASTASRSVARAAVEELFELRRSLRLDGLHVRDLIDEGRR